MIEIISSRACLLLIVISTCVLAVDTNELQPQQDRADDSSGQQFIIPQIRKVEPQKPNFILKQSPGMKLVPAKPPIMRMPKDFETGAPLERGQAVRTPPASCAGNTLSKVTDILGTLAETAGGTYEFNATCNHFEQELFTGVTLGTPTKAKPAWLNFGGRGEIMADAGICALRGIGLLPNGKLLTTTSAAVGPMSIKVEQTLGYLDFQPANKTMEGYQNFRICGPVLGCLDAQQQRFKATVVTSPRPSGMSFPAGDYPIQDAYGLLISADEDNVTSSFALPPIPAPTPIGIVNVTPYVNYMGSMHVVGTPFEGLARDKARVQFTRTQALPVKDLYGRSAGRLWSGVLGPGKPQYGAEKGWFEGHGWSSQHGLGSRHPQPDAAIWNEPVTVSTITTTDGRQVNVETWPRRPDLDLQVPRSGQETQPQAEFKAGVNIVYDLKNQLQLLPAAIRNLMINGPLKLKESQFFVNPNLTVSGSSQFNMFYREGYSISPDMKFQLSNLKMNTGVSAYGSFDLYTGLDLHIVVDIGLTDFSIINIHPRAPINLGGGTPSFKTAANEVKVDSNFDTVNSQPVFSMFQPFTGGQVNGENYVRQCLETPPPAKAEIPDPKYEPGDAGDLVDGLVYPCNICLVWGEYNEANNGFNLASGAEKIMPSSSPLPADKQWVCNNLNNGCYDLCTLDTTTSRLNLYKALPDLDIDCGVNIR